MFVLPILGALAGWAVASVTPTRYTAHSYLLIVDASDGAGASAVNVAQATARVATKPSVLAESGGDVTLLAAAAEEDLTATASPDAPLVDLAASAGTAEEAVRLANDLSDHVNRHISRFSKSTRVESEVFAEASLPSRPASPNTLVNVIAGLAVGVVAASVLFVVGRR
jgi:capsular polysaccharide biosynthesis protein